MGYIRCQGLGSRIEVLGFRFYLAGSSKSTCKKRVQVLGHQVEHCELRAKDLGVGAQGLEASAHDLFSGM